MSVMDYLRHYCILTTRRDTLYRRIHDRYKNKHGQLNVKVSVIKAKVKSDHTTKISLLKLLEHMTLGLFVTYDVMLSVCYAYRTWRRNCMTR